MKRRKARTVRRIETKIETETIEGKRKASPDQGLEGSQESTRGADLGREASMVITRSLRSTTETGPGARMAKGETLGDRVMRTLEPKS